MAASPDAAIAGGFEPAKGVAGIAPLARDFDGFVLDQWGVLHDGTRPYPGARQCLERLREAGKRVVILSNSGRREAANIRLMESMGFPPALYERFVSAGEDARAALERRADPFHARLGRRYFGFLREGNASLLEGLALARTERIEEADFLVVIGIDSPARPLSSYEADLAMGVRLRLPMVCANPDIARVSPEGLIDAPGVLARRYEELGGEVFYHGKPYPAIYESCLEALDCPRERVIAIGDSIEHDVLGAARAGLPSAFVAGGIHMKDLECAWGALPEPAAWRRFLEAAPAAPDYLVPAFVW